MGACTTCGVALRSDNVSGYCRNHKHLKRGTCLECGGPCQHRTSYCFDCTLLRRKRPLGGCQMPGCGKPLSEHTVTGFCREHCFQAKKCAYEGCTARMSSWNVTDYCQEHYSYGRKLNDPRAKNPWVWSTMKIKVRHSDMMVLRNLAQTPADERRELPLSALPLSGRARNALTTLECATLGSLEAVDIHRLSRMEGVGRATVVEIVSRMKAIKLVPKIRRRKVQWSKKRRANWEKRMATQQTEGIPHAN